MRTVHGYAFLGPTGRGGEIKKRQSECRTKGKVWQNEDISKGNVKVKVKAKVKATGKAKAKIKVKSKGRMKAK